MIGGAGTGSSLTLQSTSGVGATDYVSIKVGNNGATEAVRVLSGGALLAGAAGANSLQLGTSTAFQSVAVGGGARAAALINSSPSIFPVAGIWNQATSGDSIFQEFLTEGGGTQRGTIDFNRGGTLTRYNTTSDMTLKTLIGDAPQDKSVGILASTRLREFYWNEDKTKKPQISPFAQELYETYKGAVSVGGEYEEDGVTKYRPWGVDKTAFTFHLIAGWQRHEAIIEALTARIAALEAK